MVRSVAILLVLALAGPARADDELDVPGLDAPDLRGDALVWDDATFYLEPWDGGASIKLTSGSRRPDDVGHVVPVRITSSTMRQFVEIEPVDRLDCAPRRWLPDRRLEALHLFVRREDLAPVLVKPYAATYADGTRAKLAPGIPVLPTRSGEYVLALRGDRLTLPIPHASVGYIYTPGHVVEPPPPSGKLVRLDRNLTVELGDQTIGVRAPWLAPDPGRGSDPVLLHWTTRCAELVVKAPATSLRPLDPPRPSPVAPPVPATRPSGFYIPDGAPLAIASKRDVAVAASPIPIGPPSGETACFDATIAIAKIDDPSYPPQVARQLRLCAPASAVTKD